MYSLRASNLNQNRKKQYPQNRWHHLKQGHRTMDEDQKDKDPKNGTQKTRIPLITGPLKFNFLNVDVS